MRVPAPEIGKTLGGMQQGPCIRLHGATRIVEPACSIQKERLTRHVGKQGSTIVDQRQAAAIADMAIALNRVVGVGESVGAAVACGDLRVAIQIGAVKALRCRRPPEWCLPIRVQAGVVAAHTPPFQLYRCAWLLTISLIASAPPLVASINPWLITVPPAFQKQRLTNGVRIHNAARRVGEAHSAIADIAIAPNRVVGVGESVGASRFARSAPDPPALLSVTVPPPSRVVLPIRFRMEAPPSAFSCMLPWLLMVPATEVMLPVPLVHWLPW